MTDTEHKPTESDEWRECLYCVEQRRPNTELKTENWERHVEKVHPKVTREKEREDERSRPACAETLTALHPTHREQAAESSPEISMALPQNEYVAFLDELAQANLDIALRRVQNDLDEDPDPESSRERMRLEMEWETHWTPLTAEQTPPFMEASATLVLQCREDGIGTLAQSQELMAVIKKGADKASVEDDSTRQE